MAANFAGKNVEVLLWSCTLSGSNKEYTWDPTNLETKTEEEEEEMEGPKLKPSCSQPPVDQDRRADAHCQGGRGDRAPD